MENKIKYLSLFSGIGGFELGTQQAYDNRELLQGTTTQSLSDSVTNTSLGQNRFTCIGFSEIDKYAIPTYQKHYPTHHNYGDIKLINADELPDFDLLVGGFPCQAFSIAGKRKGFEDTRGTLFFEIARILKAKQPRLFCLENVKGLLSHDNGNTFRIIVSTLNELGYDLQWQVLNSKNHGVPQNRERVFIVGHLRGTCRPKVFPFTGDSYTDSQLQGHVANTLKANPGGAGNTTYIVESELDETGIVQLNSPIHSNDRVYSPEGISPTLNTMQGGQRQPFIALVRDGTDTSSQIDTEGV